MEPKLAIITKNFEMLLDKFEKEDKEYINIQIPYEDCRIITEVLKNETKSNEKCVAVEDKKLSVSVDELADTAKFMTSPDYKERFKAEYHQTKIRYEKLKAFNNRIEAAFETNYRKNGVEMPVFDCPQDMLKNQQRVMGEYLHILEVRAVIEGVDLTSI